jgi:Domain of unknown function (DUF4845)
MRTIRHQQGLTPIATIAILILVVFAVFLLFKMVPVYLEYFNVASSVNSLKDVPDLGQKSRDEVRELLKRRLEINDVKRVKPEHIKVNRSGNATTVSVAYEVRVPLLGNIDLLFTFDKTATFS